VNGSVDNGTTVSATATVAGDDIKDVRASQRSDSAVFGVIKELPQTGVAMTDMLMLLSIASAFLLSLTFAGVEIVIKR